MKMRAARLPRRLWAVFAGALVLVVALSLGVGRFGGGEETVSPTALQRIEVKNRNAASEAAAIQRIESAQAAEAADREAELREAAAAQASDKAGN